MTTAAEDRGLVAKRGGDNLPLEWHGAQHDGWRSVRLEIGTGHIGLATAAYSYNLTSPERVDVARRIAALWNLAAAHRWTTEEIENGLRSNTEEQRND